MVPHVDLSVVGDRGVADAKTLGSGKRGRLLLRGPHVTPFYYNNGGFMTETVDDAGFAATSREATVDKAKNAVTVFQTPQTY